MLVTNSLLAFDNRRHYHSQFGPEGRTVRVRLAIFCEISACDIPDGRCGIVRFHEAIRNVIPATCSGVMAQGIGHIELCYRVIGMGLVVGIELPISLRDISVYKGLHARMATAVRAMPFIK